MPLLQGYGRYWARFGPARLRKRFVGAIAPGANISVPIGEPVGGLFDHVPACTEVGQYGCVIAYSTYNAEPPADAGFSRVDTGYWIYPEPRLSASEYEVMCTNPARLDGGDGTLEPLVNFDYLVGVPASGETAAPWSGQPDYYKADCKRRDGAHWLNLSKVGLPGDTRPDLGAAVTTRWRCGLPLPGWSSRWAFGSGSASGLAPREPVGVWCGQRASWGGGLCENR